MSVNNILVDSSQQLQEASQAPPSPPWPDSFYIDQAALEQAEDESQRASRREWLYEEDEIIIDQLLEISKTSTAQGGFKGGAYMDIALKLNDKARADDRPSVTKDQVKGRANRLKTDYWAMIDFCVSRSGWDWDDSTHRVLQFDKKCWDEVIKLKPKTRQWKTRPWPLYRRAEAIWAGSKATGESVVDPSLTREPPKRGKKHSKKRKAPADVDDPSPSIDYSILASIPGLMSTPTPDPQSSGETTPAPMSLGKAPPTPSPASKTSLIGALENFTVTIGHFNHLRSSPMASREGGVLSTRRALLNEVADADWLDRQEKVELLRWVTSLDIDVVEFTLAMSDPETKRDFIRSHLK